MPLIGGTVEHVLLVPLVLDGRARAVWIQVGRVKVGVQAQTHPGKAAGSVRGGVSGEVFPVVPGVHGDSDAPLLEIAGALNPHGLKLGLAHRRQQQCRQDGDDRNDYQQLDQSKACPQPRNAATGATDPVNGYHCHPNLQAKTSLSVRRERVVKLMTLPAVPSRRTQQVCAAAGAKRAESSCLNATLRPRPSQSVDVVDAADVRRPSKGVSSAHSETNKSTFS